jgi:hypothetical protein
LWGGVLSIFNFVVNVGGTLPISAADELFIPSQVEVPLKTKSLIFAALAFASLVSGCNKACRELEDVCGRCADPNVQAACLSVVDESNEEDCADSVAGFESICQ